MSKAEKVLRAIRKDCTHVRYEDLKRLCIAYFGEPRQNGTSHAVFKTPWPGDPRVNIQKGEGGKAKGYQVKQVIKAIDRLLEGEERSPS